MKKSFLLIDGNSFCYRAFYAIKSLSTSSGIPTNAVFGFVTMLNKLINEHKPHYVAVAFDLKGPTFRHKKFADYKVQRKPMPDELSAQIPLIKELLRAYRIAIFEHKGYEADDIIATLADKLADSDLETLIVTGDKDMLQLVNDKIKLLNPHKDNLILDETWARKRFGVAPAQIVEIMALSGDASDNIPGVPGIGEATAIELIQRFGTLEAVLTNAENIGNKGRAEKLKAFSRQARMSRELATLDSNIAQIKQRNCSELLEELRRKEADSEKLFRLFKRLEFKALMAGAASKGKETLEIKFISSVAQAEEALKTITKSKDIAVYFWPPNKEPMRAKISGASFSFEEKSSFFFSMKELPVEIFRPVLEDKNIKKMGQDLKYAKVLLSNYGIELAGISFDAMLASYLIDGTKAAQHLSSLALEYLDYRLEDTGSADTDRKSAELCCRNATTIVRLSKILHRKLKEKGLLNLFENIEMPLIEVLADMEREGVCLDRDLLLHLSRDFEQKLKKLTADIYEIAGEEFNISSPKQLGSILFDKLKLPRIKRTKTGSSTDTEVLQRLAGIHPIAGSLLEFREVSKLKSTYVEAMMKLVHPKTGRIHTSFNQAGTATGRLACSRPNLQNIPIKTELGRKIRQVFIADKKAGLLLSADYSQIELRLLAHLSGDKQLISAFKEGLDIHNYTASLIFAVNADRVTTQMRNTAKTVNFGIIYGMGAFSLSKDLGIKQNQAQEFIDAYFQRYPGVKDYIGRQIKQARAQGYVTTLLRRRRYIPELKSENEGIRRFAERVAINTPVQGSASDLIKAAMIEIHHSLKAQGLAAKMLLQVHDELVFTLPQEELKPARALIKDKMENVLRLKVPVEVSVKVGKNWLEVK